MYNENAIYQIALTKLHHVGPSTARLLMRIFGSPEKLFEKRSLKEKKNFRIKPAVWKSLEDPALLRAAESELNYVDKHNIRLHFFQDPDFPWRLNLHEDSPVLLYSRGHFRTNPERVIAVVGTRNMTEYGQQLVENLLEHFQSDKIQVISGLAYGVDTAAHRYCVQYGIETIAVLGHGLDRTYPFSNRNLAERIIEQGGLLTEFGKGTLPDRENFPMRNRIIAGLCDALVVVETKESGGSIISAEIANSYHREVFAFPGNVFSDSSRGCHHLIRDLKAQLITHPNDLIKAMQWDLPHKPKKHIQMHLFDELVDDEKQIVHMLNQVQPVALDALHQSLNFSPSQLASLLLNLEMKGIIRTQPGKRYTLTT